jgi:hypothetical protein
MTLKSAALLALIGTALMTVLTIWQFIANLLNFLHGAIAPVVVLSTLIGAFGWLSVALFFYFFQRAQARG